MSITRAVLVLVSALARVGSPSTYTEQCPLPCQRSLSSTQSGSSNCVELTSEVLGDPSEADGAVSLDCLTTCKRCKAVIKWTWDCDDCQNGCVYVWGHQSYERDGTPETFENGSSTGSGSVRQVMYTACGVPLAGPVAQFGVTVGGLNRTVYMACLCQ